MTSEIAPDPAPVPPEPSAPEPPAPEPPAPAPGVFATLAFSLATAATAFGVDRILALAGSPRAARWFQASVMYAGRVARDKPVLGSATAHYYSYGFLGQEALSNVLDLLIAVAAFVYLRRQLARPFALDRPTAVKTAKVGALVAGIFVVLAVPAGLVLARTNGGAPLRDFLDRLDLPLLTVPLGLLLSLVSFVGTAPLAEELVFRGIVYRALRRSLNVPLSVLIQAAFFAACHLDTGLDPALIVIPYLWGIAAAMLFERTGSLAAAVLLHSLGNAGGLLVVAVVMGFPMEIYALFGGL